MDLPTHVPSQVNELAVLSFFPRSLNSLTNTMVAENAGASMLVTVGHQVYNCPNGFPNPDTYQTLTEEMANQAMAQAAVASTYNSNTSSSYSPHTASHVEEV